MLAPLILLMMSFCGVGAALVVPGLADLILVAAPMAVASLYLLLRAALRGNLRPPPERADARRDHSGGRDKGQRQTATRPYVVVDGSNVMHWHDNTPQLETLKAVVRHLSENGLTPGVVFDANAGYKLSDRYHHDAAFGKMLGLPQDQVLVVPKGTPADVYVLKTARMLRARVVSNDRFRDWQADFPEVAQPGHVIRGGYRDGVLWLDPA